MKLRINRQVLLSNLNKVSKAVNQKNPLIALTGIKFTLNDNELELIGSDNNLSIKCIIPSVINNQQVMEIDEIGSIVINERIICEIAKKFDSDMIEIEIVDNVANIRSDKSIQQINVIPAIDYPSISFEPDGVGSEFNVDALELKSMLDQTLFATSLSEARPILTGVNFKCDRNVIECISTDTFRLSKRLININDNLTFNVTLPRTALEELNKIIELGSNININVSPKKVIFALTDCIVSTRVISGSFPDVSRLIPQSFSQVLTISTKELVSAVDRASILLTEKNNVIKLNMKQDEVFISARTMEVGKSTEKLNEFGFEGEELIISFSARYLLDAIRALDSEEISLCFTGDMKPIILTSKTNSALTELILPVRTYN